MRALPVLLLVVAPFLVGLNRPLAWGLAALLLAGAALARPAAFLPATGNSPLLLRSAWVLAALFGFGLPLWQLAGGPCGSLPSATACVADSEANIEFIVLALLLLGWMAYLLGPLRPRTDQVLSLLAIAGGLQAAYGLANHFLGTTPLFMTYLQHHIDVPIGGFTNRNHFAAFLYICIFAAIALILRLPPDTGSGRAGRLRLLLDQRVLWRLLVVLMVLALIATRSRAGNAVFVIGLGAGFAWLYLVERRRATAARSAPLHLRFVALLLGSVLLLDALLVGSLVGLDKLQQRIADTSLEGENRDGANRALLARPESFTLAGHGSASYPVLFERFKPAQFGKRQNQAHNDYLQLPVERGWIGTALFALLLTTLLAAALRSRRAEPSGSAAIRFALVAATSALLLHASVEYFTQVPSIWLAWLALLSLTLRPPAAGRSPAAGAGQRQDHAAPSGAR